VGSDLSAVWTQLAAEIAVFQGVSFAKLPETGLVLNQSDFANLTFVEGETLHYKPAAAPAAVSA